jgi:hypothetical protein
MVYIVNAKIIVPEYIYVADNCYGHAIGKEIAVDVDTFLQHKAEF